MSSSACLYFADMCPANPPCRPVPSRADGLALFASSDNIDYNALKHEIKVHTTRDQAAAIVIPGHQDPALQKFEDRLYLELCRQHDRVDLFVSTKADEISRRLGTTPRPPCLFSPRQYQAFE